MRVIILSAFLAFWISPAASATMTFDDLQSIYRETTYTENGITVSGNGFSSMPFGSRSNESIHIDDAGTDGPNRIVFSMDDPFDALSFDLSPIPKSFGVCYEDQGCSTPSYFDVLVKGFRGNSIAASLMFDSATLLGKTNIVLGSLFGNLSSFSIETIYPDVAYYRSLPGVTSAGFCAPCSHFNIDNVSLAPVPLPPGLLLSLSGFGLAALFLRKRRKLTSF